MPFYRLINPNMSNHFMKLVNDSTSKYAQIRTNQWHVDVCTTCGHNISQSGVVKVLIFQSKNAISENLLNKLEIRRAEKKILSWQKKIFLLIFFLNSCGNLQVRPTAIDLCNKNFWVLRAENSLWHGNSSQN